MLLYSKKYKILYCNRLKSSNYKCQKNISNKVNEQKIIKYREQL